MERAGRRAIELGRSRVIGRGRRRGIELVRRGGIGRGGRRAIERGRRRAIERGRRRVKGVQCPALFLCEIKETGTDGEYTGNHTKFYKSHDNFRRNYAHY